MLSRLLHCLSIALILAGSSHRTSTDYAQTLIAAPGTFPCFNNQLIVKVIPAEGGKLNYSIENARVGVGASKPPISAAVRWFMFPETIHKVWIYDGVQDVTLVETDDNAGVKFTSNQVVTDLLSHAPSRFAEGLPAEVKRSGG